MGPFAFERGVEAVDVFADACFLVVLFGQVVDEDEEGFFFVGFVLFEEAVFDLWSFVS